MLVERQWPAFIVAGLVQPEIRAAVEAHDRTARRQIHEAYASLEAVSRGATALGQRLHAAGYLALAPPVALAATVARQQIAMARGTDCYPGPGGVPDDPSAAWDTLPAEEAAALLVEDLDTIALALAGSVDGVPTAWGAGLRRSAGVLLQVTAQLQEVVDEAQEEARRQAPKTEDPPCS